LIPEILAANPLESVSCGGRRDDGKKRQQQKQKAALSAASIYNLQILF
jgi:hypothetical protein